MSDNATHDSARREAWAGSSRGPTDASFKSQYLQAPSSSGNAAPGLTNGASSTAASMNKLPSNSMLNAPLRAPRSSSFSSSTPRSPLQAQQRNPVFSPNSRPTRLPKRPRSSSSAALPTEGGGRAASFRAWLQQSTERASLRCKVQVERLFRKHGRRIARHPIQTLLVACLIITSLFYPAVGIYLWSSKGGPGVTRGDSRSVWRSLSTPLLDSFASSGRKHHNSLRDLRMIWDDAPDLRGIDARDADAYLGSVTHWHLHDSNDASTTTSDAKAAQCRSVRVEHVFVTTDDVILGLGPRFGALHVPILRSAWNLQRSIESMIGGNTSEGVREDRPAGMPRCVRAPNSDDCLVLSPLSYWDMDKDRLSEDIAPTNTILQSKRNVSDQGIPLTLSTTLAGRSHLFNQLPRADHLALTFFLEDDEGCHADAARPSDRHHKAWSSMLRNITGRQVGLLGSDWHTPKELVLQFVPRHPEESFPTQKVLLAVGYIAMVVWLTRGLFSVRNVHSPFGLAFTACIELLISMTVAISICALSGVRLTLIPWEILPFVIVVIGSENMFALTNAIISTPISLTVSSRLAAGFEKAAVPIAVTVLSDVFLMALVALLVDVRAVREFCIFAIFALIVDFFMQMTFYATVLSIDMQRLELADLLSQNSREVQMAPIAHADDESIHSDSASFGVGGEDEGLHSRRQARDVSTNPRGGKSVLFKLGCRAAWQARTARTATLSLLLAFMAGIYLYHGSGYTSSLSYPFSVQENERAAWSGSSTIAALPTEGIAGADVEHAFDPYAHLDRGDGLSAAQPPAPWWHSSPSAIFWQALNPDDSSSIHVKVEPWTVVSLPSATRQNIGKRNFASWAIFRPRVRAMIWFFKLTILPIAGTTALLWVLLLYLLKDTELLDAQQNKMDAQDDEEMDMISDAAESSRHGEGAQLDVALNVYSEGHGSDVVLLRQSGSFLVSIAIDTSLQVTRQSKKGNRPLSLLLSNLLRDVSVPSALAANANLDVIVVGHANGQITLLSLSTLRLIRTASTMANGGASSGDLTLPTSRVTHVRILTAERQGLQTDEGTRIATFHRDGSVWLWHGSGSLHATQLSERRGEATWSAFEASRGAVTATDLIVACASDGSFVISQTSEAAPYVRTLLASRSTAGIVKSAALVHTAKADGKSGGAQYIALGTVLGKIVVYEAETSRNVAQIDLFGGPIVTLRSVDASVCSTEDGAMLHSRQHKDDMEPDLLVAISPSTASIISFGFGNLGSPTMNFKPLSPFGAEKVPTTQLPPPSSGVPSGPPPSMNGSISRQSNGNGSDRQARNSYSSDGGSTTGVSQQHERTDTQASATSSPTSSSSSAFPLLSLLADLDCRRGGSDVVLDQNGEASLVGLRRRPTDGSGYMFDGEISTSRWELFEMKLSGQRLQSASQSTQRILNDGDCRPWLQRVPLQLDESKSSTMTSNNNSGSSNNADVGSGTISSLSSIVAARLLATSSTSTASGDAASLSVTATNSPSRTSATLSFTRISRVQAFYKRDAMPSSRSAPLHPGARSLSPSKANIAAKRLSLTLVYGNAVAVVHVQTKEKSHRRTYGGGGGTDRVVSDRRTTFARSSLAPASEPSLTQRKNV